MKMNWLEMYPKDKPASIIQMAEYIGKEAGGLWLSLLDQVQSDLKIKVKASFSTCSGKPGWNLKLHKSGKSYGTLYPEEGSFAVFIVIAHHQDTAMQALLPQLDESLGERYERAEEFMKIGKWMMYSIHDQKGLDSLYRIIKMKCTTP
ncbi:MAG: DUF3788 family protein [Candidatus Cloacimonadaceae bacterium]|nr:DUF3788 family protein [Candidatus Cloacimonadaceae bacterium]